MVDTAAPEAPAPAPVLKRGRKAPHKPSATKSTAEAAVPGAVKAKEARNAEAGSSKHAQAAAAAAVADGQSEAGEKRKRSRRKEGEGKPRKPKRHTKEGERLKNVWECVPLAQSEVSRVPPVWTRDGRFYISAQNSSIMVHDAVAPFERKSTLTAAGRAASDGRINALLLSPVHPSHVLAAGEDGYIRIWNLESGKVVHVIHIPSVKLRHMCIGQIGEIWEVFVTAVPSSKSRKSSSTSIMHFHYPSPGTASPDIHRLNKLSSVPTALFLSPSSTYLVALAANKAYTFLLPTTTQVSSDWTAQLVKFVSDQPLTCGAFAPADRLATASSGSKSEEWFATGDELGVIRLWHGLGQAFRLLNKNDSTAHANSNTETERKLPTTSLRWHAHAVAALAFTPSGSQLLSVGEESVLVQWHLGSGRREYIPRLGGRPIISLAIKNSAKGKEEEWWMAFADGSVVKVGAGSGRIENVGDTVKIDPLRQVSFDVPYPLALHPSTGALVLPSSNPGTLQFVDPAQSSLLFDLEVAPSNRIARRDEKELVPVAVERVAFSDTVQGKSEWMATIEGRKGDEFEGGGEVRNLKIWRWDGERYIVNTQFPRPHGVATISSLAFSPLNTPTSPARPHLLTTAHDGSAKLWHLRQAKKSEHGKAASRRPAAFEYYWSPRSSWTYRSLPIHSAAFTPDSTLVALTHGSVVSLWDTESNVLLRALDCGGDTGTEFRLLAFGGSGGRYLVAAGSGGVACWDLLSCERVWAAKGRTVTNLLTASTGDLITTETVASKTIISSWSPTSVNAAPVRSITIAQPLRSLVHLPSSSAAKNASINFAAVSTEGDLFRLGDNISATAPPTASLRPAVKEKLSIWQEMFGQHAFVTPTSSAVPSNSALTAVGERKSTGRPSAVYDGPSHTLPPSSLLFDGFMEEILASGSSPALADAAPDQGILYEQEPILEPDEELLAEKRKARVVGDKEVKELEGFFAGLLNLGGASKISNGSAILHTEEEDAEADDDETLVNGAADRPLTPKGKQADVRPDEEEEDRVVQTPLSAPGSGAGGRKGRKRRAPRDTE